MLISTPCRLRRKRECVMMAKARVAPLHTVIIPRLELQAACISVQISKVVESDIDIPDVKQFYWQIRS